MNKETLVYFQFFIAKGHRPLLYINFSLGSIDFELTKVSENYETFEGVEDNHLSIWSELKCKLLRDYKHISYIKLQSLPVTYNKVSKAQYKTILFNTTRI